MVKAAKLRMGIVPTMFPSMQVNLVNISLLCKEHPVGTISLLFHCNKCYCFHHKKNTIYNHNYYMIFLGLKEIEITSQAEQSLWQQFWSNSENLKLQKALHSYCQMCTGYTVT